jgi:hypothetical protein
MSVRWVRGVLGRWVRFVTPAGADGVGREFGRRSRGKGSRHVGSHFAAGVITADAITAGLVPSVPSILATLSCRCPFSDRNSQRMFLS